jgi:hypothetical protein
VNFKYKLVTLAANSSQIFALNTHMCLVAFNSELEEVHAENRVDAPKSSTQLEVDEHGNIFIMFYNCERVGCSFNMTHKVRVFSTRLWRVIGETDVDVNNQFKLAEGGVVVLFSNKTKKATTLKFCPSVASFALDGGFLRADETSFPHLKGDVHMIKDRISDCVSLFNPNNLNLYFN